METFFGILVLLSLSALIIGFGGWIVIEVIPVIFLWPWYLQYMLYGGVGFLILFIVALITGATNVESKS